MISSLTGDSTVPCSSRCLCAFAVKRLEKVNEVLESESESDAAKLSVLQKLDKLTLTTQEVIDAKIGVTISKLRKASDAETAAAANKLRQKWKKQAAAS
jgi:hypothetical protein